MRDMRGGRHGDPCQKQQLREGAAVMNAVSTPPDRLSTNPASPFHDVEILARGIGIRFNGLEKTTVEEYCVSEGWIRVAVGKTLDRHGNPLTTKLNGRVEPYFRDSEQA